MYYNMPKGTSQAEVTMDTEKIKPVPLYLTVHDWIESAKIVLHFMDNLTTV